MFDGKSVLQISFFLLVLHVQLGLLGWWVSLSFFFFFFFFLHLVCDFCSYLIGLDLAKH